MSQPTMHAAISSVKWLLGRWRTVKAEVFYPTMTTVSYTDEIEFTHEGQPGLNYSSQTKHAEKGHTLHMERGFLRVNPNTYSDSSAQLALLVAHTFGLTEISEGEVLGQKIKLESKDLSGSSFVSGTRLTKVQRFWELVDDNTMECVVFMETSTQPLQEHLRATFKRL